MNDESSLTEGNSDQTQETEEELNERETSEVKKPIESKQEITKDQDNDASGQENQLSNQQSRRSGPNEVVNSEERVPQKPQTHQIVSTGFYNSATKRLKDYFLLFVFLCYMIKIFHMTYNKAKEDDRRAKAGIPQKHDDESDDNMTDANTQENKRKETLKETGNVQDELAKEINRQQQEDERHGDFGNKSEADLMNNDNEHDMSELPKENKMTEYSEYEKYEQITSSEEDMKVEYGQTSKPEDQHLCIGSNIPDGENQTETMLIDLKLTDCGGNKETVGEMLGEQEDEESEGMSDFSAVISGEQLIGNDDCNLAELFENIKKKAATCPELTVIATDDEDFEKLKMTTLHSSTKKGVAKKATVSLNLPRTNDHLDTPRIELETKTEGNSVLISDQKLHEGKQIPISPHYHSEQNIQVYNCQVDEDDSDSDTGSSVDAPPGQRAGKKSHKIPKATTKNTENVEQVKSDHLSSGQADVVPSTTLSDKSKQPVISQVISEMETTMSLHDTAQNLGDDVVPKEIKFLEVPPKEIHELSKSSEAEVPPTTVHGEISPSITKDSRLHFTEVSAGESVAQTVATLEYVVNSDSPSEAKPEGHSDDHDHASGEARQPECKTSDKEGFISVSVEEYSQNNGKDSPNALIENHSEMSRQDTTCSIPSIVDSMTNFTAKDTSLKLEKSSYESTLSDISCKALELKSDSSQAFLADEDSLSDETDTGMRETQRRCTHSRMKRRAKPHTSDTSTSSEGVPTSMPRNKKSPHKNQASKLKKQENDPDSPGFKPGAGQLEVQVNQCQIFFRQQGIGDLDKYVLNSVNSKPASRSIQLLERPYISRFHHNRKKMFSKKLRKRSDTRCTLKRIHMYKPALGIKLHLRGIFSVKNKNKEDNRREEHAQGRRARIDKVETAQGKERGMEYHSADSVDIGYYKSYSLNLESTNPELSMTRSALICGENMSQQNTQSASELDQLKVAQVSISGTQSRFSKVFDKIRGAMYFPFSPDAKKQSSDDAPSASQLLNCIEDTVDAAMKSENGSNSERPILLFLPDQIEEVRSETMANELLDGIQSVSHEVEKDIDKPMEIGNECHSEAEVATQQMFNMKSDVDKEKTMCKANKMNEHTKDAEQTEVVEITELNNQDIINPSVENYGDINAKVTEENLKRSNEYDESTVLGTFEVENKDSFELVEVRSCESIYTSAASGKSSEEEEYFSCSPGTQESPPPPGFYKAESMFSIVKIVKKQEYHKPSIDPVRKRSRKEEIDLDDTVSLRGADIVTTKSKSEECERIIVTVDLPGYINYITYGNSAVRMSCVPQGLVDALDPSKRAFYEVKDTLTNKENTSDSGRKLMRVKSRASLSIISECLDESDIPIVTLKSSRRIRRTIQCTVAGSLSMYMLYKFIRKN